MAEWFKKRTLGSLLDDAARRFAAREALCFEGNRWTFEELRADVDRTAQGLLNLGVQAGDKVSLWMNNCPEWIYSMFAVAKIGAVLVPINTRFRTNDMEYVVHQSDSTTLIMQDRSGPVDYLGMLEEVCPELRDGDAHDLTAGKFPQLKRVVVLGAGQRPGTVDWADMMASAAEVPHAELEQRQRAVDPDGTVLLMYTSGTTGFPKGVMHNHNIQRTLVDAANRQGMTPRDVILMYLPLFHCFGLYEGPIMSLVSGARMVLMPLFEAGLALRLIEQERATVLKGLTPTSST